ncbi:MAG: LytTR family DNA-binding domain-containing protein [Bacteroidota bacterium]
MKIALIDDELSMRDNLKALLHKYIKNSEVIGEANGVATGLRLLNTIRPDVLFLDVKMKDGTGFDLLSQYGTPNFHIVFVTGYDQYAIKAFKYSAVDYLLKPVDPEELTKAVAKVESAINIQKNKVALNALVENRKNAAEHQKIVVADADNVYLIDIQDISHCESTGNYTLFYLTDGRKILITKTLKDYEELLREHGFFRVHRSHIINLRQFEKLTKRDGGVIIMKDGSKLPLAVRRKQLLVEALQRL